MKVMLDRELAELYGVETSQLKRAVRRNIDRFPSDFMFELSIEELGNLRCQIGISSWGGTRYKKNRNGDRQIVLDFHLKAETVWLTQAQMVELFQRDKRTISDNIRNVFKEGELVEAAVVRDFRITASDEMGTGK